MYEYGGQDDIVNESGTREQHELNKLERSKGQESFEYDIKKTKNRTLLTNKKEVRPPSKVNVKLEKIDEKTLN